MSLVCMEARQRMQARVAGLSEADLLRLEEHTASCDACRAESVALSKLVDLAHSAMPRLSDAARQRTIANALSASDRDRATEPSVSGLSAWGWRASFGALAMVAVIGLGLWLGRDDGRAEPRAQLEQPTPAVQSFRAVQARRVVLDGAVLDLEAGTAVDWDARVALVTLHSGRVRAQVDPRQGKPPFVVSTPAIRVVVIGTDFEVGIDSVLVHEGVVRIEALDGRVLAPGLRAMQRWPSIEEPTNAATSPAATSQSVTSASARAREPVLSVDQWLSQARTRLSEGDVVGARAAITRAQRSSAERVQRAEAETLLAECFQVEGKVGAAIAQYQSVARAYRDQSAGDNAAYAASRLTLMRGDRARAAELFRQYLSAHPDGLFRDEARRALTKLESTSDDKPER